MKYVYSGLVGSLASTVALVLAGHAPAILVLLGLVTGVLSTMWVHKFVRVSRLGRKFRKEYAGGVSETGSTCPAGKVISKRQLRKSTTIRRQPIGAPIYNANMLPSVAQDVLSALINLKVPFGAAEEAVFCAYKPGDSFDDCFRKAVVSARSFRKVA
jgi:hypothetical protein